MLAGLIGNGTGVLIIGMCMITMRHVAKAGGGGGGGGFGGGGGGAWKDWVMRVVIFFMFAGGTALTLVGIGQLVQRFGQALLGLLGPDGSFIVGSLAAVFLLGEVVIEAWRNPSKKVAWSAVFLAFTFTLVTTGPIAQIAVQLHQLGSQYSNQIDTWMRS